MANLSLEQTNRKPNPQAWYRPTVSLEHGVYIMLLVSGLIGAAVAQNWNWLTTLALICAYCGFQAEHPLVLQIRQRSSWKPRFLVWGSVYGVIAAAIALFLFFQAPILIWIYLAAIAAVVIDAISVFHREQKSILNEIVTFAAVCLTIPFVEAATTGTISLTAIVLWMLTTLYFSSTIFTVKLRKPKTSSVVPGLVYHAIAILIVVGLWWVAELNLMSVIALGIAVLKFGFAVWQQEWYRSAKIQAIAIIETVSALIFSAIVALSILPTHL
jgi:hypothetical protein